MKNIILAFAAVAFALPHSVFAASGAIVSINGNFYAAKVKDMPVLVKISEEKLSGFYSAKGLNNGQGLKFTDLKRTTEYPFEVDTWDPNGTSLVWVRVPEVEPGTKFIMQYGNDEASTGASAEKVWEGFDGVWHMTSADDVSGNKIKGIMNPKATAVVDGAVGGAFGSERGPGPVMINELYPEEAPVGPLENQKFTVSCWMRLKEVMPAWTIIAGPMNANNQSTWGIVCNSDGPSWIRMQSSHGDPFWAPFETLGMIPVNKWTKIDAVFDDKNLSLYIDGAPVGTIEVSEGSKRCWIHWLGWGGYCGNGEFVEGDDYAADFDECRIYAGALDPARIAQDYAVVADDVCDFLKKGGVKIAKVEGKELPKAKAPKKNAVVAQAMPAAPKEKKVLPPVKVDKEASVKSDANFGKNPYGKVELTPAEKEFAKQVTWCSLGTSITYLNDYPLAGGTAGYQYFTMDMLGMSRDNLVNKGVSGALIGDAPTNPSTSNDIYTIEFGINCWGHGMTPGTLEDYKKAKEKDIDWSNFASVYGVKVRSILNFNPDAVIILTTPRKGCGFQLPNGNWYLPTSWDQPSLDTSVDNGNQPTLLADYAKVIREIGKYEGYEVVDWFEYAANQEHLKELSADEALHPNDKGYKIMADLLAPAMAKAIKQVYVMWKEEADFKARSANPPPPVWKVQVLDPTHIVVQADVKDVDQSHFWMSRQQRLLKGWQFTSAVCGAGNEAVKWRDAFEEKLEKGEYKVDGKKVDETGYWVTANGLMRFQVFPGREEYMQDVRPLYNVFLNLKAPLKAGKKSVIDLPDGEKISFTYDANEPSPLFKVNQTGYFTGAKEKYVYLGGFLGPLGPWKRPADGTKFELVDAKSGKVVLTGDVVHRMDDAWRDDGANKTPYLGEETCEMDISAAPKGTYFVRIDGIGRSMDFDVNDTGVADVFALHMKGLFQQRCGCAKTKDLTHWTDNACHMKVYRGFAPPQEWEYNDCFVDKDGKESGCGHFPMNLWQAREVEKGNKDWEELSLPGGWHDAADFDRRPMHMRIVGDLATDYIFKPENFTDSQLAVPERGNGTPDILDEAIWGLKHLLAGQQKNGGVGTWIETVRHPDETDHCVASTDPYPYFLSRATRASSMEYAGYAALLARALEKAGDKNSLEWAKKFKASAIRAWDYATTAEPAKLVKLRGGWDAESEEDYFYNEYPGPLSPELVAKAAINLYALTQDKKYTEPLTDEFVAELSQFVNQRAWAMSAYILSEIWFTEIPIPTWQKIKDYWKMHAVQVANEAYGWTYHSYAYRMPYYGPDSGWVHTMNWGNIHPFHQAKKLIAAHAVTGDQKYLDAAYLAMDFHCGCNPNGETWTSGLGKVYPTSYLSLVSLNDGIAEYVPGIPPYRNTFGIAPKVSEWAFNWDDAKIAKYPFLRRWGNVEAFSVGASEFTVWETLHDAACVCGYLMGPGQKPKNDMREPAKDVRDLPGFWTLP